MRSVLTAKLVDHHLARVEGTDTGRIIRPYGEDVFGTTF
jgi:hypothetical protein